MTTQKKLVEKLFPTKVEIGNESILVVPNWQDGDLFSNLGDYIRNSGNYSQVHMEDFLVPEVSEGLRSKNPGNAGPTIPELVEVYGHKAIEKAHNLAMDNDATVVFLHTTRGYSQLGVTAFFYKRE